MSRNETKSVFDAPVEAAEEARLDAIAEAEIEAGKGVPHESVSAWLKKLAQGERLPPPDV